MTEKFMDSLQRNGDWRQISVDTCHLFNTISRLSVSGLEQICMVQIFAYLHDNILALIWWFVHSIRLLRDTRTLTQGAIDSSGVHYPYFPDMAEQFTQYR
jgi:hypothetical protein